MAELGPKLKELTDRVMTLTEHEPTLGAIAALKWNMEDFANHEPIIKKLAEHEQIANTVGFEPELKALAKLRSKFLDDSEVPLFIPSLVRPSTTKPVIKVIKPAKPEPKLVLVFDPPPKQ